VEYMNILTCASRLFSKLMISDTYLLFPRGSVVVLDDEILLYSGPPLQPTISFARRAGGELASPLVNTIPASHALLPSQSAAITSSLSQLTSTPPTQSTTIPSQPISLSLSQPVRRTSVACTASKLKLVSLAPMARTMNELRTPLNTHDMVTATRSLSSMDKLDRSPNHPSRTTTLLTIIPNTPASTLKDSNSRPPTPFPDDISTREDDDAYQAYQQSTYVGLPGL
jgi:hypothetical protein